MLLHHSLDGAKYRLNSESDWLVNDSFLLTESLCKNYLFSVTSLWRTFVNLFLVVHPTHILVHPWVHRAHRLKSAALADPKSKFSVFMAPIMTDDLLHKFVIYAQRSTDPYAIPVTLIKKSSIISLSA